MGDIFQSRTVYFRTTNDVKNYKEENHINCLEWPTQSPYLNVIENVRLKLKIRLQQRVEVLNTADELKKIKIKLHLHVSYFCYLRDKSVDRHFYINRNYGGCPNDKGWLMVVDTPVANYRPCKFDKLPRMKYPYIVYGPNNKVGHYQKTGTFSNISYCNFSVYVKQVHLVTFLIEISMYMCYSLSV